MTPRPLSPGRRPWNKAQRAPAEKARSVRYAALARHVTARGGERAEPCATGTPRPVGGSGGGGRGGTMGGGGPRLRLGVARPARVGEREAVPGLGRDARQAAVVS